MKSFRKYLKVSASTLSGMKSVWEWSTVLYLVVHILIIIKVECISSDHCQYDQVLALQTFPGESSAMAETGRQFTKLSGSLQKLNKSSLKNMFFKSCMQMRKIPLGLRISFNLCQDINDYDLVNLLFQEKYSGTGYD